MYLEDRWIFVSAHLFRRIQTSLPKEESQLSSLVYPILSSFCTVHTPHWTFNGSSYTLLVVRSPFHSLCRSPARSPPLLLSISPDRIRNTKSGEKRYPRIGSCDKIRLNPAPIGAGKSMEATLYGRLTMITDQLSVCPGKRTEKWIL